MAVNAAPKIAKELQHLKRVPIAALEPLQGNLKDLSKREYGKLKRSLTEHGIIVPFFVWLEAGKLLDGHQRRRVFIGEGWTLDVPIIEISAADEQEAKRKLLVIASQYGKVTQEGWDEFTFDIDDAAEIAHFDGLPFVFGELPQEEPEAGDAEPQIDKAEELREAWGVELGQMWRLPSRDGKGEHRLICGDCTDKDVYKKLGDEKADLSFFDPPFDFDAQTVVDLALVFSDNAVICGLGPEYAKLGAGKARYWYEIVTLRKQPRSMPRWPGPFAMHWGAAFLTSGGKHCHHRDNAKGRFGNGSYLPSVLGPYAKDDNDYGYGKPVKWAEDIIFPCDAKVIADLFSGSGTTIIAAENLSRQCRAVEISPAYVAVALQRYLDAFGITPELIQ